MLAAIHRVDPLPWLWPIVLAGFAAYLISLGLVAMVDSPRAVKFLSGFAQTRRANAAEAAVRSLVGFALMGMAPAWSSRAAAGAGLFLIFTALAMLVWPDAHQRVASRSVASVASWIGWIGLASLLFGLALIVLLIQTAY